MLPHADPIPTMRDLILQPKSKIIVMLAKFHLALCFKGIPKFYLLAEVAINQHFRVGTQLHIVKLEILSLAKPFCAILTHCSLLQSFKDKVSQLVVDIDPLVILREDVLVALFVGEVLLTK